MVIITLQRDKCLGCNYCVELAYDHWRMSKKDGKSNLLGSVNRKGFHTVKANEAAILGYSEPVGAIIMAFIFLHELPGTPALLGGLLILFSGYLILRAKIARP